MNYSDPDLAFIYDRAAKAGSSPRITDTAGQVSGTSSKVAGATDGKGPERLTGDASEIGKTLSALATDAAISKDVWDDLKKAADAWNANAPKAAEMTAAETAVTDAQAKAKTAREAADAAPDDKALADAAEKAGQEVIDAKTTLIDLQRKRKAANKALLEAISRAITKAKRITGGQAKIAGDGTTGVTLPGQSTGNGTGTQSTGSGSPAARTGSGTPAAKPAGTPAATPGAGKPAETPTTKTSSTSSGLTPTETAALVAAAQGQQNQQPQQAAQQPTAQMPTMPTVPQQANQQQNKGTASEKPEGDKLVDAALGSSPSAVLAGLGGGSPSVTSTSSTSPSPGSSEHVTQFRAAGTPITGTSLGGSPAVNTQNPVTSGQSATGLTTQSDTSGRPQGSERTAYSPTPAGAETKTSGASGTGTGTGQNAQQQAGGRPVGSGMPMMPMTPMTGGAPAAPASRQGDGEQSRGVASTSDPLGLMHERGDAVEGGTIAQNRPDRDKPNAA